MNCPACQKKLRRFQAGTVALDGCASGCGGIWFDDAELDKVNREHSPDGAATDFLRAPPMRVAEDGIRPCPKCKKVVLEKKLFSLGSGVIMDVCPKCAGIWLDHGELEKIHEALHPGPVPRRFVARQTDAVKIPITFALVEQVQQLRRTPRD